MNTFGRAPDWGSAWKKFITAEYAQRIAVRLLNERLDGRGCQTTHLLLGVRPAD